VGRGRLRIAVSAGEITVHKIIEKVAVLDPLANPVLPPGDRIAAVLAAIVAAMPPAQQAKIKTALDALDATP